MARGPVSVIILMAHTLKMCFPLSECAPEEARGSQGGLGLEPAWSRAAVPPGLLEEI